VDSSGGQSNNSSFGAAISADGRYVAFASYANNLVPGDTNGTTDVFVHDRVTGATERVSVDPAGNEGDRDAEFPALSGDGRMVSFDSSATTLVANDTNKASDVFVHDRSTGATRRVSVDPAGAQATGPSGRSWISADGLLVAFLSDATDLVANDTNGSTDVFLHGCLTDASSTSYGVGFPGTLGIPTLGARTNPVLGATLTLDLTDSQPSFTVGLLFVGFQRASLHSSWGGELLVAPSVTLLVGVQPGGTAISGTLPLDERLGGMRNHGRSAGDRERPRCVEGSLLHRGARTRARPVKSTLRRPICDLHGC
jgi:hypothetical protein